MPALDDVLALLEQLAPLRLAGGWDNVGLLLEGDRRVERILLTIDLTEAVCDEAIEHDVDLVLAYHPPIFRGLKQLTHRDGLQRSLLRLARRGVHLYSPHSALDAVVGGMNDWLLEAFDVHSADPIQADELLPDAGAGRIAKVRPQQADVLITRIKDHLGLPAVRVAGPLDRQIETVGVCPGAGTGVFASLASADLLLTGEMSHHDVLSWVAKGTVVVLTEHTNTERGYLPRLAERLRAASLQVHIATTDADPLELR